MLESYFRNLITVKRLPDTLNDQLQRFTTSLKRQGYADRTVRLKLRVLTNLGQWLGRNNLPVTNLDDQLVAHFSSESSEFKGATQKPSSSFSITSEGTVLFVPEICLLTDHRWLTF